MISARTESASTKMFIKTHSLILFDFTLANVELERLCRYHNIYILENTTCGLIEFASTNIQKTAVK